MASRLLTVRILVLWAALAGAGSARLAAQATADKARLIFSVGLGQNSGGGTLWRVARQPYFPTGGGTDTLDVSRVFRSSVNIAFSGTYFPGDHLGVSGEVRLIGLGTTEHCSVAYTGGFAEAALVCGVLDGQDQSAASVMLAVSGVYRIWSHSAIHPYIRAGAGLAYSPQSLIRTRSDLGATLVPIYEDEGNSVTTPSVVFGGGVVMVAGHGYQVRFELVDTWMRLPTVATPVPIPGMVPLQGSVGRHFLGVTLALDVVLERKRGRRY